MSVDLNIEKDFTDFLFNDERYMKKEIIDHGRFGESYRISIGDDNPSYIFRRDISFGDEESGKTKDHRFVTQIDLQVRIRPHYAVCKFEGFKFHPQRSIFSEWISGPSLQDLFDHPSPEFTPTVKSMTAYGVACALMHMHAHASIHRFLKPSKIKFDKNWEPKVIDFAFARVYSDTQSVEMTNVKNETYYNAPELINYDDKPQYDHKVDVWNFGMILYHLLTGSPPWKQNTSQHQIQTDIVDGLRPDVPGDSLISNIIRCCWHPLPENRPEFYQIVYALRNEANAPFANTDMDIYNEYRDRLFDVTLQSLDAEQIFSEEHINENEIPRFKEEKAKADSGNSDSQLTVGLYYTRGIGTHKNYEEAYHYFELAAEQGNNMAKYHIGHCLISGRGIDIDQNQGAQLIKEAADAGLKSARLDYATFLRDGKFGIEKNAHQALDIFYQLAVSGDKYAQYKYAKMCYDGKDVPVNKSDAYEYFMKAGQNGIENGIENQAYMLLKGDGVPQNIEEGMRIYKQAVKRGQPLAMNNLGIIYLQGDFNQPKDIPQAFRLLSKASQKGDINGMFNYAVMLLKGIGCDKDLNEARKYIKRSAEKGHTKAQCLYAQMLENAQGGPEDRLEAVKYYKLAADSGFPQAIIKYAKYIGGFIDGVEDIPLNKRESLKYLERFIQIPNQPREIVTQANDMIRQIQQTPEY